MWNDKGFLILNKIDKVIDMVDKFSLTDNNGGCLSQDQMKVIRRVKEMCKGKFNTQAIKDNHFSNEKIEREKSSNHRELKRLHCMIG